MANFVNVTKEEMQLHLEPQGFKEIKIPGTVEAVFAKRVDHDGMSLSLRVYTGINPNGHSRDVGKDAIRLELFYRDEHGQITRAGHGCKRVHRVVNWKKNLQARLDDWESLLGPSCGSCGRPMTERKGKNGSFYGCSGYPACRVTQSIAA